MVSNILLGSKNCGPCKRVRNFLESEDIFYTYIDIDTPEGREIAKDWCVRAVPSMTIEGKMYTGDTKIMGRISEQK